MVNRFMVDDQLLGSLASLSGCLFVHAIVVFVHDVGRPSDLGPDLELRFDKRGFGHLCQAGSRPVKVSELLRQSLWTGASGETVWLQGPGLHKPVNPTLSPPRYLSVRLQPEVRAQASDLKVWHLRWHAPGWGCAQRLGLSVMLPAWFCEKQ